MLLEGYLNVFLEMKVCKRYQCVLFHEVNEYNVSWETHVYFQELSEKYQREAYDFDLTLFILTQSDFTLTLLWLYSYFAQTLL